MGPGIRPAIFSLPTLGAPPGCLPELGNTTRLKSLQGFLLKERLGLECAAKPSLMSFLDGDTTCPEDSSIAAWNVTKAGHVAQALCPGDRTGMVKRPCGPDGVWGPIHSNCTDAGLLALLLRAQVKLLTLLPTCPILHDLSLPQSGPSFRVLSPRGPAGRLFSFSELEP